MNKRIIVYVVAALIVLCVICVVAGLIIQSSPTYKVTATARALATAAEAARPTAIPVPTHTPAPTATLQPTGTPKPTATPGPTHTPAPTDTPAPTPTVTPTLSPTDQLRLAIQTALGDGNRDVPRIQEFDFTDGTIWVVWAIDDNFTEGLVKRGAQLDIVNILKAVDSTGIDYQRVDLLGTFSMVDVYGNTSESDVISVSYSQATVQRINWDNFLTDDIYTIADDLLMLHPEFRP